MRNLEFNHQSRILARVVDERVNFFVTYCSPFNPAIDRSDFHGRGWCSYGQRCSFIHKEKKESLSSSPEAFSSPEETAMAEFSMQGMSTPFRNVFVVEEGAAAAEPRQQLTFDFSPGSGRSSFQSIDDESGSQPNEHDTSQRQPDQRRVPPPPDEGESIAATIYKMLDEHPDW